MRREFKFSKIINGGGCKLFETEVKGGSVFVITNDFYYYETPLIETGRKIKSCKALSKIKDYKVHFDDTRFKVLVNNRGAELVYVVFKDN